MNDLLPTYEVRELSVEEALLLLTAERENIEEEEAETAEWVAWACG